LDSELVHEGEIQAAHLSFVLAAIVEDAAACQLASAASEGDDRELRGIV
jgi:hypothetical protein